MFIRIMLFLAMLYSPFGFAADNYAKGRESMMQSIKEHLADTADHLKIDSLSPQVEKAMQNVPRHKFVPKEFQDNAYENRPLPIGYGQTISQPYIVAIMTELLQLEETDKVLEVGTGSGYQAAILSGLVDKVFTIEIIESLGKRAKQQLKALDYENVEVDIGDGYYGREADAPFDAIIVTAAASHVPPPLVKQLKPDGRMIIPVGSRFMVQELLLVKKDDDGNVITEQLLPVAFVPLTGGH